MPEKISEEISDDPFAALRQPETTLGEPSKDTSNSSTYFFHGRILPERTACMFHYPKITAKLSDTTANLSFFCFGSEFNGTMTTDRPLDGMFSVSSILRVLIRSIVDRLSFMNICGYDFEITGAIAQDTGNQQIFGVNEAVFFDNLSDQTAFARQKIPFMDEFLRLRFHDVRLDHALRCFNHAMRDSALTTLFCYMAIETLARRIVELKDNREVEDVGKNEWQQFRASLAIKEHTIKEDVKKLSDRFRHGDFIDTTWEDRKKALALTWEIIRRAMHFIKYRTTLSGEDFPEL